MLFTSICDQVFCFGERSVNFIAIGLNQIRMSKYFDEGLLAKKCEVQTNNLRETKLYKQEVSFNRKTK